MQHTLPPLASNDLFGGGELVDPVLGVH
jgi:hypothetical protein